MLGGRQQHEWKILLSRLLKQKSFCCIVIALICFLGQSREAVYFKVFFIVKFVDNMTIPYFTARISKQFSQKMCRNFRL